MGKTYKPYPQSKLMDPERKEIYWYNFITTNDPKYFVWTTLDRQAVRLKDMRISHIKNILAEIDKGNINARYKQVFLNELDRREKDKLIKAHKAGKILYGSN